MGNTDPQWYLDWKASLDKREYWMWLFKPKEAWTMEEKLKYPTSYGMDYGLPPSAHPHVEPSEEIRAKVEKDIEEFKATHPREPEYFTTPKYDILHKQIYQSLAIPKQIMNDALKPAKKEYIPQHLVLNLVCITDKKTGKKSYFGVNDKHYDAMLACEGSSLEESSSWEWLGDVTIEEHILAEEGRMYDS